MVGVVNAVFMSETFKCASSDDTVMVKSRQRAARNYLREMRKLFAHVDRDGSGSMTKAEFLEAFQAPELHSWLSALELDTSDLPKLFSLIDNGDGAITADELVAG